MTARRWIAITAGWFAAGFSVSAAHVAAVLWITGSDPVSTRNAAPEAIMVDLVAMPLAPQAAPVAAADRAVPAPAPDRLDAPDFTPPPLTMLPPLASLAELMPRSALTLTASDRPELRPKPRPRPVETAAKPRKPRPATPAKPQQQAQPAKPSSGARPAVPRQPVPQTGTGQNAQRRWQAEVGARISRHMARTPLSGGGASARVQVAVTVGADGATSARIVRATGDGRVDAALSRQADRMPRMPRPPGGSAQSFVLPISIRLR